MANILDRAIIHALLGQTDQALEYLDRMVQNDSLEDFRALDVELGLDVLRATDRYQKLKMTVRAHLDEQRAKIHANDDQVVPD